MKRDAVLVLILLAYCTVLLVAGVSAPGARTPAPRTTLSPGQPLPSCGGIFYDPTTNTEADRGYC